MGRNEAEEDPTILREVQFTTTHWSAVLLAADGGSVQATRSLESLCRMYWYPLYAYVRRRGFGPEEAQDLTQAFFARLLEKDALAQVDRAKGRFRSFLLASVNHFLANEWDRSRAIKRGGRTTTFSLDEASAASRYAMEIPTEVTPETLYERQWALELLDRALNRLGAESLRSGRQEEFECLSVFLSCDESDRSYAEIGSDLGLSSTAIASRVYRLRQRYRELVRDEIAQTVARPEDLDDELRLLFSVFS